MTYLFGRNKMLCADVVVVCWWRQPTLAWYGVPT